MTLYYKIRQTLLQNATEAYYKMRQVFYYKMRQLLQNATFITNYDSTLGLVLNSVWNRYFSTPPKILHPDLREIRWEEKFSSWVQHLLYEFIPVGFFIKAMLLNRSFCLNLNLNFIFRVSNIPQKNLMQIRGTFHTHWQISKKRYFEKYCSCDKAGQFSVLLGIFWKSHLEKLTNAKKYANNQIQFSIHQRKFVSKVLTFTPLQVRK